MAQQLPIQSRASSSETIVTLQVLRGLAAMLVVFAHAIDYQQMFLPGTTVFSRFYSLENFGAVGVDIFFVISGFIMAVIAPAAGRDGAARRFAIKRFVRIVPIYWLLTVVTLLIAGHVNEPNVAQRIFTSFTFIPLYSLGKFLAPMILVGWSLSFEMYFYLLIALVLFIRKRGHAVPAVACLFGVFALIGMIARPRGTFLAFALNPILAEFALGCLIGHCYRTRKADLPLLISTGLFACGVICLVATIFLGFGSISEIDNTMVGDAGSRRLLIWGIPSALLVSGIVFNEYRLRRFVPAGLRLIGDASYSIYLLQLLVLKQFAMRWSLAGFERPDVFIPVALCFGVLAGIAHYGIVERPLTKWLSDRIAGLPIRGTGTVRYQPTAPLIAE